jgi:glutathione S-transferase
MKRTFILHDYKRCPFCIRTRIVLSLKNIPYEIVDEPLRKWTDWMRDWSAESNERPRVPVLREVAEDGIETIHTESNQINLMLDTLDEEPKYTPIKGSSEYQKMEEWFDWCDGILKPLIDIYKYGKDGRFDPETLAEHTSRLEAELLKLESALTSGNYLLGDKLSLADIAIIPFIRQIMRTRGGEFDFRELGNVYGWTMNLLEADWFETEVMRNRDAKNFN